jgi:hypothetical protein
MQKKHTEKILPWEPTQIKQAVGNRTQGAHSVRDVVQLPNRKYAFQPLNINHQSSMFRDPNTSSSGSVSLGYSGLETLSKIRIEPQCAEFM